MEKASTRAKNNLETGTQNCDNPFTTLNNTSDEVIGRVIDDLDLDISNSLELISTIKAEELLRSVLAEANYKEFLLKTRDKGGTEDYSDLS